MIERSAALTVVVVPDTVKFPSTTRAPVDVTVPVNVGLSRLALRSSAVCVAVDTGFAESAVLSTFPRPTEDFVSAATAVEIFPSAAVPAAVIASASAESAYAVVASSDVSAMPWTFVVSLLWVDTASSAYVFVASAEVSAIP